METVHTDSAYKIVSRKDYNRGEPELHQVSQHNERTLISSDNPDHFSEPSTRVTLFLSCNFHTQKKNKMNEQIKEELLISIAK